MRDILGIAACGYTLLGCINLVGLEEVLTMLSVCTVSSLLGVIAVKIKNEVL